MFAQRCVAAIACVALASCGLPRGAGFQSEVLAASNANTAAEGEEPVYDFTVYEVNRNTLPVLQGWPATGGETLLWIVAQEQPASLSIATGDTVQVTIWDAEENSIFGATGVTPLQPEAVSADGRIFVPYIGDLRVAGMSPSTARQRIEEELIRTVPSAQVQLSVEPGRSNTANLASGFAAPGLYPLLDRNVKILDLFSQAGGPNPELNSPQVRLVRGSRTFGIPFERLLRDPRANIAIRGGDRIYIEDDNRKFITLGATGTQTIVDFPEVELSALEALALIGGVNAGSANPEGILILREYAPSAVADGIVGPPQERVVFNIDLTSADGLFSASNFMLEGDDLIYGTESVLGSALTLVSLTNTISGLANRN
ncbi:polysaccharide biosynthesis/export family protein [Roseobacter sp. CCS2]|uniref:polysaccharide biosynthesis/export family protein n=1 Tax=Roseobacter sp. CCS2 TaxID=391593 RepID=UPI0000F3F126|nr:polysaccharide biosynthesis/export family protein [Roseobacter sp. CCS2]EBA11284.1 putative capsule polysaccharide exporter [Roseobacter sp. CCS2]